MKWEDPIQTLWDDPIVAEIRKRREEYAGRFNYDVHAVAEDLKRMQIQNGWVTVDYSQEKEETKPMKRAS
jgi:hypothetical protein